MQTRLEERDVTVEMGARIGGLIAVLVVVGLVLLRNRLGPLNAAFWLVVWGAIVVAGEHPQFAISLSVPFEGVAEEATHLTLVPHARLHFFMAGVYALIGLALLCVIAWTLLRTGRRSGWYALFAALLVGGGLDLVVGGLWFQHGSPFYRLFAEDPIGFGWEFLYGYLIAWGAALAISYRPVFRQGESVASGTRKGAAP